MEAQSETQSAAEPLNIRIQRFGRIVVCNWFGPPNVSSIRWGQAEIPRLLDPPGASKDAGPMYCIDIISYPQSLPSGPVLDAFKEWGQDLRRQFARLCFVMEYDADGLAASLLKALIEAMLYVMGVAGFSMHARTGEDAIRKICLELATAPDELIRQVRAAGLMR